MHTGLFERSHSDETFEGRRFAILCCTRLDYFTLLPDDAINLLLNLYGFRTWRSHVELNEYNRLHSPQPRPTREIRPLGHLFEHCARFGRTL